MVSGRCADRPCRNVLVGIAERAAEIPDSWAGLVSFFDQIGVMFAGDRGLRQVLNHATYRREGLAHGQDRIRPAVRRLIERAQADGHLRADLHPSDWPCIEFMISAAAEHTRHVRPELWRRYLALLLDGLRAHRGAPTPLPEPALTSQEIAAAMRTAPAQA